MLFMPESIHRNTTLAKAAVSEVAKELGVTFNCNILSRWFVDIASEDKQTFLALVNERMAELLGVKSIDLLSVNQLTWGH